MTSHSKAKTVQPVFNALGMELPAQLPHDIYMVAVAGTGMGSLAVVLADKGHVITGSDKAAWAPMGPMLRQAGVQLRMPYDPDNIPVDCSFAVVGNAVSAEHPEVLRLRERQIAFASMPEVLEHYVLQRRPVWCAAGTHGKTTSSAMLAHIAMVAGLDPGYLIGGLPNGWSASGAFGAEDSPFVIEGDEYSSVFYDHSPKFVHYRASSVVLPSLEYDHADVYPDEGAYLDAFAQWFEQDFAVYYDAQWPHSRRLLEGRRQATIGLGKGLDIELNLGTVADGMQNFALEYKGIKASFESPAVGAHNARNWALCIALALDHGCTLDAIAQAVRSFPGIAKRQTVLTSGDCDEQSTVIFDFGHHPTEIDATLNAIRARYPDRALWAAFEPRSYSSRRNVHQDGFNRAFDIADKVWLAPVFRAEAIDPSQRLDLRKIAGSHRGGQGDIVLAQSYDEIVSDIEANLHDEPAVIVCFSNGDFADVPQRIAQLVDHKGQ